MPTTALRVLVIDDEARFCDVVSSFLRGRGYEVATASSGAEALAHLETSLYEVVLLDVVMPGLSGLELLKVIRERPFPPRVIMVTATEEDHTVQQAMRQGAEAFMCKPVNFDTLEQLISRVWRPHSPVPDPS